MKKIFHHVVYVISFGLTYILYLLCRLLGLRKSCKMLGGISVFFGLVSGKSKKAQQRLNRIFPIVSDQEQKSIVVNMWRNLGAVAAEYIHLDKIKVGDGYLSVEGLEHLESLRDDGMPGLIFTGHIANWEMVAVVCRDYGVKSSQVYRAANNPFVDRFIRRIQLQVTPQLISKGSAGGKKSLESLNRGEHLILLVDQKMNNGISVPFFERAAMTAPGLAKLAERYKCPVLPAQVARSQEGHLKVIFYPPVYFHQGHVTHYDFMLKVHSYLEQWICQNPGQWLWVHNRWGSF